MDKKFSTNQKRNSSERSDSATSSAETQSNFSSLLLQNAAKNLARQKRAKPDLQANDDGSNNIWQNLSTIFKNDEPTFRGSPSVKLLQEKQSSSRRLNTIFSNRTNDRSQGSKEKDERDIAMAVRLPSGATANSVAVTVELEAIRRSRESPTDLYEGSRLLKMECTEDTDTKTIYSGVLKVPTNSDISKLAGMPLYLLDSQEKLLLTPTTKLSHRIVIRPSEDMLIGNENQPISEDVKIKLHFEKAKKLKEEGRKKSKRSEEHRILVNVDKGREIPNVFPETAVCAASKSYDFTEMQNVISNASNLAPEMLQNETAIGRNLLNAATSYEDIKASSKATTEEDEFRACLDCVRRKDETIAPKTELDCFSEIQTGRKRKVSEIAAVPIENRAVERKTSAQTKISPQTDKEERFSRALANERIIEVPSETETETHFPTAHMEDRRKKMELRDYFPAQDQKKKLVCETANFAPTKFEKIAETLERNYRSPSVLTSETSKSQRAKEASIIEQEDFFPASEADDKIKLKRDRKTYLSLDEENRTFPIQNNDRRSLTESDSLSVQRKERRKSTKTETEPSSDTELKLATDDYVPAVQRGERTSAVATSDYPPRRENKAESKTKAEERRKSTSSERRSELATENHILQDQTDERRSRVRATSDYALRKENEVPAMVRTENGSFAIQKNERKKSIDIETAPKLTTNDNVRTSRTSERKLTVTETSNYTPRKEAKPPSISLTEDDSSVIQRGEKRKSSSSQRAKTSVTDNYGFADRTGERTSTASEPSNYIPRKEEKLQSISKTKQGASIHRSEKRKSGDPEIGRTSTVTDSASRTNERKSSKTQDVIRRDERGKSTDTETRRKSLTDNYLSAGRTSNRSSTRTDSLSYTPRKENTVESISDREALSIQKDKKRNSETGSKSATRNYVTEGQASGKKRLTETESITYTSKKEEKLASISDTKVSSPAVQKSERTKSIKSLTASQAPTEDYISADQTGRRKSAERRSSNFIPRKEEKMSSSSETVANSVVAQRRKSSKTETSEKSRAKDSSAIRTNVRRSIDKSPSRKDEKIESVSETKDDFFAVQESGRRKSSKTETASKTRTDDSASQKTERKSTGFDTSKYTSKQEKQNSSLPRDERRKSSKTETVDYSSADKKDGRKSTSSRSASEPRKYIQQSEIENRSSAIQTERQKSSTESEILSDNYIAAEELDDDTNEPMEENSEQPFAEANRPAQNRVFLENSQKWVTASYFMPSCRVRDNFTQYSNTNFVADKSIEIQASLLFPTFENYDLGYNAQSSGHTTPVSSQLFLTRTPSLKITPLMPESSRSNKSSETNLPMSSTSTNTDYSNTLMSPSDYGTYYDGDNPELQVPSNSPSSCAELKDSNRVSYDVHAQYYTNGLAHQSSSWKKSERSRIPVSSWHSKGKYSSRLTDSFVEGMTSESDVYFTDQREPSASNFTIPPPDIKDKTLELLESARIKLINYLDKGTRSKKAKKFTNHDLEDLCEILPIHQNLEEFCSRRKEETRSVNVYTTAFSTSGGKQKHHDAEINQRCYEDDDEYYERQRRKDVRRYFQEETRNQDTKKNFNFYLSGDGLERDACIGSSVFHVYPLIMDIPLVKSLKSQAKEKLHEAQTNNNETPSTSFDDTQSPSPTKNSKNDINSQLENEINSLQQMYDEMCSSMNYIINQSDSASTSKNPPPAKISGSIENIDTDLTKTFSDLQMCLSTIDKILAESTNSLIDATTLPNRSDLTNHSSDYQNSSKIVSDLIDDCLSKSTEAQSTKVALQSDEARFSDLITDCLCKTFEVDGKDHDLSDARQKTYLTMEHDIKRTIKELLKESKVIKEAVILNGGKEEAEPPFFEYIDLLDAPNPLLNCKAILDDIVNLSLDIVGDRSQTPQDDVNYILNILLEEVAKNNVSNEKPILKKHSKDVLNPKNFVFDLTYKTPGGNSKDLQKGDSKNEQGGSKIEKTYFCTNISTPRIPKTSFSFGETPAKFLKLQSSDFKPAVRTRDGVTIMSKRSISRNQSTSRLINELLKLDDQTICSKFGAKNNDDLSLTEDFFNSGDISKKNLELTTASRVLKNSTLDEPNLQMQEVLTYASFEALLKLTTNNHTTNNATNEEANDNQENSYSENTTPTPPTTNSNNPIYSKPESSTPSATGNIEKSKKCLQIIPKANSNVAKSQPSTSGNTFKITETTDEEELINTIDLTEEIPSSSENEYFIPVGVSKFSQKSSNVSRAHESRAYDSSSSDEVEISRKKTTKKRKRPELVEIKSKTSLTSNSASGQLAQTPTFSNDESMSADVSYIALKPTQGRANLPTLITNRQSTSTAPPIHRRENEILHSETNISEISVGNTTEAVDTEYEGDLETIQMSLPYPKHTYKSEHELNDPEEIAKIEENVRENNQLERAAMVILLPPETPTHFDYEDSHSEYSANTETSA